LSLLAATHLRSLKRTLTAKLTDGLRVHLGSKASTRGGIRSLLTSRLLGLKERTGARTTHRSRTLEIGLLLLHERTSLLLGTRRLLHDLRLVRRKRLPHADALQRVLELLVVGALVLVAHDLRAEVTKSLTSLEARDGTSRATEEAPDASAYNTSNGSSSRCHQTSYFTVRTVALRTRILIRWFDS
jgi:hypothetical protein